MASNIVVNTKVLIQEVFDTIEENPPETSINHSEIVTKLGSIRKNIRHNEVLLETETPNEHLTQRILEAVHAIRDYVHKVHEINSNKPQSTQHIKVESSPNDQSTLFTITDINRCISELKTEFSRVPKDLTDEEIIQLRNNLSSNFSQLNEISKRIESVINNDSPNENVHQGITNLCSNYSALTSLKSIYTKNIQTEIEIRQVYKQKLFSESNLNIKLEQFSGLHDSLDYYTFKSKFEKIYLRTTPKHLLAELLKNNYLKDPALSSVKSLDNIDEI